MISIPGRRSVDVEDKFTPYNNRIDTRMNKYEILAEIDIALLAKFITYMENNIKHRLLRLKK
ncbi:MAG: hypothetical protein LBN74_03760 [Prevotella sp.]|jgi:hypothetical protein|nr:hypothetical protein [Prevotella sp.]